MNKKTSLLITFCSLLFTLYAQNNMQIQWQGCYGGNKNDEATGIVQADNGYLVLGTTRSDDVSYFHGVYDILVVNIDSLGNLLWERAYGGSESDYSTNIIKDNFGYYYFGGAVSSNDGDVKSGNSGGYDRWIVKIDSEGNIIWEQCYGGSMTEYGAVLKLLNNGNILVYGASFSNDGDVPVNYGYLDNWLMIINTDGDIIESRVYGNMVSNNIFDIIETHDGGYFFASKAGDAEGMVQGEPHGMIDVWVVKLDSNMNIEWQEMYGGSKNDYGFRGIMELDDGYIFLATTNSNDGDITGFHGTPGTSGTNDIWVVRIDIIGNIIWQRCLGGTSHEVSATIHQSENGGFIIFAETSSNNGDVLGNTSWQGNSDIWMVNLSAEGELIWQECYGGNGNERVSYGVLKKSEHNYIVAGRASFTSGDVDCSFHELEDIWIFEIKDCSHYQPTQPQQPTGKDYLCVNTDSITTYTTQFANGAWYYEWELAPESAGIILPDSLTAQIQWSPTYEGTVIIKVRSTNDCGTSAWSDSIVVNTYICLGTEEYEADLPIITVYPNPVGDVLMVEYNWLNKAHSTSGTLALCLTIIEIVDIYGGIIAKQYLPTDKQKIGFDVKNIAPGLYFVRVVENGEIVGVRKVVIE